MRVPVVPLLPVVPSQLVVIVLLAVVSTFNPLVTSFFRRPHVVPACVLQVYYSDADTEEMEAKDLERFFDPSSRQVGATPIPPRFTRDTWVVNWSRWGTSEPPCLVSRTGGDGMNEAYACTYPPCKTIISGGTECVHCEAVRNFLGYTSDGEELALTPARYPLEPPSIGVPSGFPAQLFRQVFIWEGCASMGGIFHTDDAMY